MKKEWGYQILVNIINNPLLQKTCSENSRKSLKNGQVK